jgi:hypothetical protein
MVTRIKKLNESQYNENKTTIIIKWISR